MQRRMAGYKAVESLPSLGRTWIRPRTIKFELNSSVRLLTKKAAWISRAAYCFFMRQFMLFRRVLQLFSNSLLAR